jgi:hypothetical protein
VFFHASALVTPLGKYSGLVGTGVELKVGPSTRKEGAFAAVEVVITDTEGDEELLEDIALFISSVRPPAENAPDGACPACGVAPPPKINFSRQLAMLLS